MNDDLQVIFERGYAHGALSEIVRLLDDGRSASARIFAASAVAILDKASARRQAGLPMSISEFKDMTAC